MGYVQQLCWYVQNPYLSSGAKIRTVTDFCIPLPKVDVSNASE